MNNSVKYILLQPCACPYPVQTQIIYQNPTWPQVTCWPCCFQIGQKNTMHITSDQQAPIIGYT